jgi:hypothetical protein
VRRANLRVLTAANVHRTGEGPGAFRGTCLPPAGDPRRPARARRGHPALANFPPGRGRGACAPELTRELKGALLALLAGASPAQNEMGRLWPERASLRVERLSPTRQAPRTLALRQARAEFDRRYVQEALLRHAGNRTRTAAALGLSRQGLGLLMARYQIQNGLGPSGPPKD